jgi:hypothetical protein
MESVGVGSVREEMLRELDRITMRLASLNPERLAAMDEQVFRCATRLRGATQNLDHDPELPKVGPTAYAAQLTVLTRDLLVSKPNGEPNAAAALTELRQALP